MLNTSQNSLILFSLVTSQMQSGSIPPPIISQEYEERSNETGRSAVSIVMSENAISESLPVGLTSIEFPPILVPNDSKQMFHENLNFTFPISPGMKERSNDTEFEMVNIGTSGNFSEGGAVDSFHGNKENIIRFEKPHENFTYTGTQNAELKNEKIFQFSKRYLIL